MFNLSQQDAAQAAAITSHGHLLNMGNIDIFKIEGSGMISGDSLINMDSITIDSVEVDGIISAGISINESSGVILISNTNENGLTVNDSLFNAGDIFIHHAMEIGIQNVNGLGYLENHNTMNVVHAGQIGLLCEIATTLVNGRPSGQLQIQSALGVPLDVEAGGIVVIEGILDVSDE